MKRIVFLLAPILAVLLTGCPDDPIIPDPLPEDTTPPKVVSVYPTDGCTDAELEITINATISEPFKENTIEVLFENENGQKINVDVVFNGKEINIKPVKLFYGTKYLVKLSKISDMAGNILEEYQWSFTTKENPNPWQLESKYEIAGIELDEEGNVYTVGVFQKDEEYFDYFISKFDSKGNLVWFNEKNNPCPLRDEKEKTITEPIHTFIMDEAIIKV